MYIYTYVYVYIYTIKLCTICKYELEMYGYKSIYISRANYLVEIDMMLYANINYIFAMSHPFS